MIDILLIGIK